jgi:hypothetical protein
MPDKRSHFPLCGRNVMRALALIAVAAAAATFAAGSANASTRVRYDCGGKDSLVVVYTDDEARVTLGHAKLTVYRKQVADGFLYSRKNYSLRGRGDKVTLTAGRTKPVTCTAL